MFASVCCGKGQKLNEIFSLYKMSLKELRNGNYFCVHYKNNLKHNQRFKLLLLKVNLHLGPAS